MEAEPQDSIFISLVSKKEKFFNTKVFTACMFCVRLNIQEPQQVKLDYSSSPEMSNAFDVAAFSERETFSLRRSRQLTDDVAENHSFRWLDASFAVSKLVSEGS